MYAEIFDVVVIIVYSSVLSVIVCFTSFLHLSNGCMNNFYWTNNSQLDTKVQYKH